MQLQWHKRGRDQGSRETERFRKVPEEVPETIREEKETRVLMVGQEGSTDQGTKAARLNEALEIPFRLDSGVDQSIISEEVLEQLVCLTLVKMRRCSEPRRCVLGDGSFRRISKLAVVDLELHTDHGPVLLPKVELLVLPGSANELLIGQPELVRLDLPDLETALNALAARRNGVAARAGAAGSDLREVEAAAVKAVRLIERTEAAGGQGPTDITEPWRMLDEDDFEDEAPLVRGRGSRDQTIVDQEVEEMLDRAETAGAPPGFMTDERVAVYNHHDVWRVELGADPPAAVLAMEVRLTNPEAIQEASGPGRWPRFRRSF